MHQLATLFVSIVTLVSTVSPKADVPKLLGVSINPAASSVLSTTDQTESGESARIKSSNKILERTRLQRLTQTKALQERVKESSAEGKVNREELKKRLTAVRDEKKQQTVIRIDENIAKLNAKWTANFNKTLDRLSEVLAKMETRSQTADANGRDTASVNQAISDAQAAIAAAQEKVDAQAAKTYKIEITTEANLGQSVRTAINLFHNDLKNTKDSVQAAKRAAVAALSSLKGLSQERKIETNEQ